jgi:hypothetical protein
MWAEVWKKESHRRYETSGARKNPDPTWITTEHGTSDKCRAMADMDCPQRNPSNGDPVQERAPLAS